MLIALLALVFTVAFGLTAATFGSTSETRRTPTVRDAARPEAPAALRLHSVAALPRFAQRRVTRTRAPRRRAAPRRPAARVAAPRVTPPPVPAPAPPSTAPAPRAPAAAQSPPTRATAPAPRPPAPEFDSSGGFDSSG
jgi:hypothetical protein